MQNILELVLNLEPCILQKCNTFYFGNQTLFFLQQILLLCNMVCTGKSYVHQDISMYCLAQDDCNVFTFGFVKFKNVRKTGTVLQLIIL